jgi:adenylate kinase
MLKLNTSLSCLISLEVDEETSIGRLLERGRTSGRTDDNETVIRNRLREYSEKTLPVLDFYREKGNYQRVNGNQSIENVAADIRAIIRDELAKHLVNVVVFGYPGSGRGSQSEALARKYGLEYVATGPLLDQEIKAGTPIGRKIVALYESGQLVPDEIVVQLIEKKLERSREVKGFIFKGFPRTLVQSYILDGLLRKVGSSISRSIEIQVPMLELIKRLDERSRTERCMPYDNATAKIVQRLAEH